MSEQVEQGVAVRAARVAKRMTQAHLATAAGVSEKTVRRAEAGDPVGPESLRAVCSVLGLDAAGLSTEAECVPDAAAEAQRRLADRERRAALLMTVLTASIAVTLACMVFDDTEIWQALSVVAVWVFISGYAIYPTPGDLVSNRTGFMGGLRTVIRALMFDVTRPVAFARRAAGGLGGLLSAARVACMPPAVLAAMYAIKAMLGSQSLTVSFGALVIAGIAWGIAKSTVLDTSGLGEDRPDHVRP